MDFIKRASGGEEVVLHFGGERSHINSYTLASALVAIADAAKEANSIVNPGYEIEVVVEAIGEGSFRAVIKTSYKGLTNLFSAGDAKTIVLSIIASFIYQQAFSPSQEITLEVDESQIIVQQGDREIVISREVYEAQKKVQKSERFRQCISRAFESLEKDPKIGEFGFTRGMTDELPAFVVPQDRFGNLTVLPTMEEPTREVDEIAELQIRRAILERSTRKWEFVWRGIKISAPVLDEAFYKDFFAHKITIAPGDSLDAVLRIHQTRDEDTGIYTNERYEIIQVRKHLPQVRQSEMKT